MKEYKDKLKRLNVGIKIKYIFPVPASKNFTSVNCRIKFNTIDRLYVEYKDNKGAKCLIVIPKDKKIIINNIKFLKLKKGKDHVDKRHNKIIGIKNKTEHRKVTKNKK